MVVVEANWEDKKKAKFVLNFLPFYIIFYDCIMFSSNERALQITSKTKDSGSTGYSMMVLESPQTRDHCHTVIGSSGQWFTKPHPYSIMKKL